MVHATIMQILQNLFTSRDAIVEIFIIFVTGNRTIFNDHEYCVTKGSSPKFASNIKRY